MKVKIKSFNGNLPNYLTLGKLYEVIGNNFASGLCYILDDYNDPCLIYLEDCSYLNGGEWEIVDEHKTDVSEKTIYDKTVVIFNAPIGAGKDVSADYMHGYFQSGQRLSFKEALYEDTAEYFNIDIKDLTEYHSDRSLKEIPSLQFPKYQSDSFKQYFYSWLYVIGVLLGNKYLMSLGYYSSREALIHVSENIIKPKYGQDYYGRKFLEKVESSPERYSFASDGGFRFEILPLLDAGYNVYIVHLERLGATFDNDSRKLLTEDDFKGEDGSMKYKNLNFIKMDNSGSLDDLYKTITDFSFDLVLNQTLDHYGGNMNEYEIVHL